LVGEPAPFLLRCAADEAAQLGGAVEHPAGALALRRLDERAVAGEDVEPFQRRHLVEDLVGLVGGALACGLGHGGHGRWCRRWGGAGRTRLCSGQMSLPGGRRAVHAAAMLLALLGAGVVPGASAAAPARSVPSARSSLAAEAPAAVVGRMTYITSTLGKP